MNIYIEKEENNMTKPKSEPKKLETGEITLEEAQDTLKEIQKVAADVQQIVDQQNQEPHISDLIETNALEQVPAEKKSKVTFNDVPKKIHNTQKLNLSIGQEEFITIDLNDKPKPVEPVKPQKPKLSIMERLKKMFTRSKKPEPIKTEPVLDTEAKKPSKKPAQKTTTGMVEQGLRMKK